MLKLKEKILIAGLGLTCLGLMTSATSAFNPSTDRGRQVCFFRFGVKVIQIFESRTYEPPLVSGSLSGIWRTEISRLTSYEDNSQESRFDLVVNDNNYRQGRHFSAYGGYYRSDDECKNLAGLPHDYQRTESDVAIEAAKNTAREAARTSETEPQRESNGAPQTDSPNPRLNDPHIQFALSFGLTEQAAIRDHLSIDPSRTNVNDENLLFFALQEEKDAAKALELLRAGISSNGISNKYLVTPLMLAAGNSSAAVLQQILTRNKDQIDFQTSKGATALMYAASAGRRENVDLLLRAGADKRLVDQAGENASQMARIQKFNQIADLIDAAR